MASPKRRANTPPAPPVRTPARTPRTGLWICLALLALTLTVYAQVRTFAFVNFDDPDYVTGNLHVRRGFTAEGVQWAFTSGEFANWFPVTWLSHMLDVQISGVRSGPHHLTNVVLHALATLLLFAFLKRATHAPWPSAFVAFLFALHPLHVESVAWIAERKDVLSAFFWFLTLWLYVRYVQNPQATRYILALLAFCLGLMSKPMLVTLPFVLLLLDFWPLHRLTPKVLREKIPFFALSMAAAVATYMVQASAGAVQGAVAFPLALRIQNAIVTCALYIVKMFWPARLAVFYPYPAGIPAWQVVLAAAALAAVSFFALRSYRKRPYLAVGWLWYLGTLVPVIGLVQVGAQARADRYTYVPMAGISIMAAWAALDLLGRWPKAKLGIALAAGFVCVGCAAATSRQLGYWQNSESLFQHAVDVTDNNYLAQHNLGTYLTDVPGRLPDAILHLRAALEIEPNSLKAHTDLATALSKTAARLPEAVAEYRAALRLDPTSPIPHNNLANTLSNMPGRLPEAIAEYQAALQINPGYAQAHNNLGSALSQIPGRMPEAISQFEAALRIDPDYAEARNNLVEAHYDFGIALSKAARFPEAISHLEAALRLKPAYPEAQNNLGVTLANVPGRLPEAIAHFQEAVRLKPDYEDARYNLSTALKEAAQANHNNSNLFSPKNPQ
jgi:tetratricopeptide (TPR) repeat protein